jgi:hypothetical protein
MKQQIPHFVRDDNLWGIEKGGHFLCSPFGVFAFGVGRSGEEGGDAGGVGDWFGWVEDDAAQVGTGVVGGAEGGVVAVHGGDAAEEELGDVGDGDGVEPGDAFAGELADEVAEKGVYRVRGGEVGQVAEEFGGGVVVMALALFFEQTGVMGAQFQIGNGGEESAAMAAPVDVAARRDGDGLRRHCCRD